jgi:hypothetical protein
LPHSALAQDDVALPMFPISDKNINLRMLSKMIQEWEHCFDRRAQIRIHEKNDLSLGRFHSGANGETFTSLDDIIQNAALGLAARGLTTAFERLILTFLDDYQHFPWAGQLF